MPQEELRQNFIKYNLKPTIRENREVLDMFSNFLVMAVKNHHNDPVDNDADAQAKLILQMMLTKTLHLRSLANGIEFVANDGTILNNIIDPTIVAISIRNIFETAATFNLIYRTSKAGDEKTITYLLWVIAGLSYRQRFESNIVSQEIRDKYEFEKKEIQRLTNEIEQTNLFQALDAKNKQRIRNLIKQKSYHVKFENNKALSLAWYELIPVMGIRRGLFDNIYTYFSLYTHPSNVSVFQFGEMFENEQKPFLELTNFNLNYATSFLSIFLADYLNVFPAVKESFNQLSLLEQIILDYPNKFARGDEYSINDSWKALG